MATMKGLGILSLSFVLAAIIMMILCCDHEVEGISASPRIFYPEVAPVMTIESELGDVIDCVDVYSQPSLAHPLLRNHKVQKKPSKVIANEFLQRRASSINGLQLAQPWRSTRATGGGSGGCPEGTVPILRQSPDYDPQNVTPLSPPDRIPYHTLFHFDEGKGYEYALVREDYGRNYDVHGAVGDFTVWNPLVEGDTEFSAARVQVVSGEIEGSPTEEISAGWIVHKGLFNDTQTRLFAHFHSVDNGCCYNLLCEGFVHVEGSLVLGMLLLPSMPGSFLQYMAINIHKSDDAWWLNVNGLNVGYWPTTLFKYLSQYANSTNYGGEIFNSQPGGRHTKTAMGNGVFPSPFSDDTDRTGCFLNWDYINADGTRKGIHKRWRNKEFTTNKDCYVLDFQEGQDGFCYGGPGYNQYCP